MRHSVKSDEMTGRGNTSISILCTLSQSIEESHGLISWRVCAFPGLLDRPI